MARALHRHAVLVRVRIIKSPPKSYGIDGDRLRVGLVYNLETALASALVLDQCAEVYDALSPDERREFTPADPMWEAADYKDRPRFRISHLKGDDN